MAADFEQVKQNIADTIYENGEELITGQVMQDRLLEMVSVTEEAINDVTVDPTVNVTVNNTTGTPSGSASFQSNQFSFEFSGIKGETGNSGYTGAVGELEVVNNLNSDDATAALSAYQGKVLDGKVTQLGQEFFKVTSTDEPYSTADYTTIPFVITSPNTWKAVNTATGSRYRAVKAGQKITITANATRATSWGFLAAEPSNITEGDTAVFADSTGLRLLSAGQTEEAIVPVDCYLYVRYRTATMNANYFPSSIIITTYTTENKIEKWDANILHTDELQHLVSQVYGDVTQLSPTIKEDDKLITSDGTVGDATHYHISTPIPVKRGQKITIHSYIPKNGCGLALTDSVSSYYTPVIINTATGKEQIWEYVAPADCLVAWCYIDSRIHEISLSAAVNMLEMYAAIAPKDETGILDFNPSVEFTPKFIAAKKETNGVPPLVLQVFSDIHAQASKNLPRILQFNTEHASRIDEILNLGDMVSNQFSNDFVFGQVEGAENVLSIIGNHDTANYSGGVYDWTAHAGLDAYNKYIAPFVSNWGVTQPEDAAANGYCYYYKDYTTQGIRIVFLDVMGYDATQESWLESVLADAKANGLSVLIAAHYAGDKVTGYDGKYSPVINNYVNKASYNPTFYGSVNVVESFIEGGGKFIGWIVGHFHEDLIGKLDGTNQVCLVVDTAQFGQYSGSAEYDKIEGTPTQDAFSIVCIDTEAKTLSTFKVGCRRDKWQRTRDSVCVNYETATILCEN